MSDFLNNFSNDKYKKQVIEEQEETKKAEDSEKEQEVNKSSGESQKKTKITTDKVSNKQPITREVGSIKTVGDSKLQLSGAAFEEEKVEIDSDYNHFLLKRTITICATIIISILIFVGAYIYLNQTVAITLVDKSQTEAEKWLEKNDVNYDIVEIESNDVEPGIVISQSIPTGERIGQLDMQSLEVSSGPDMSEVVDLSGLKGKSKEEVTSFIEDNMLFNASTKYEYSDKVDSDKLIRIDFEDDSVTTKNYTREAKANFILSKGSKSDKKNLKVENFVDQTTDKVYEWNADSGVMIDEQQVSSDIPAGYIVSQSIEPGEMVGFGDILTVEVSKGPGEAVPYLIGYDLDSAQSIADDSGIVLEPTESYSNSDNGLIVAQSISSGESIYPEEESLKVTVSLGKPFIDDMTGSNLGSAVSMINGLNSQGANLTYTTSEVALTDEDKEMGLTSGMIKSISGANQFVSTGSNIEIVTYA